MKGGDNIIPLPEAANYLIKVQEKSNERAIAIQSSKDKTKYIFNGLTLGKGRLVFEIVKQYIKDNPELTFEDLKLKFPSTLQDSTGVINLLDMVESKYEYSIKKRHFLNEEDVFLSSDGLKFVVSTEWGIGNISNILILAKGEGYTVQEI